MNELLAAHEFGRNSLADVENMTEDELKIMQQYYPKLSSFIIKEENLRQSDFIDESHRQHNLKKEMEKESERKFKYKI